MASASLRRLARNAARLAPQPAHLRMSRRFFCLHLGQASNKSARLSPHFSQAAAAGWLTWPHFAQATVEASAFWMTRLSSNSSRSRTVMRRVVAISRSAAPHLGGGLEALLRVHAKRPADHVVPSGVEIGVGFGGHSERAQGQAAGQHFVEAHAQAVEVGAARPHSWRW